MGGVWIVLFPQIQTFITLAAKEVFFLLYLSLSLDLIRLATFLVNLRTKKIMKNIDQNVNT